jgi:predicted nucleic acid-binding protein
MIALVDASVLVALFNKRDAWHSRCRELLRSFGGRLVSSEAALTEALYLLSDPRLQQLCLTAFNNGSVTLAATEDRLPRCQALMQQYADLPMDFADATLVALAEAMNIREIWTLDGDFQVYRLKGRASFNVKPLK